MLFRSIKPLLFYDIHKTGNYFQNTGNQRGVDCVNEILEFTDNNNCINNSSSINDDNNNENNINFSNNEDNNINDNINKNNCNYQDDCVETNNTTMRFGRINGP